MPMNYNTRSGEDSCPRVEMLQRHFNTNYKKSGSV